jgi:glutaredoxin 3
MPKVKIYSTPSCVYCRMAKEYFEKNSVAYEEYNVEADLVARKEMVAVSHQLGVPVIKIGDHVIVGFDREMLAQLLGIK